MFDDSTLELSEFYFTLLQTLRIASEWINETSRDLAHLVARIDHLHFSSDDSPVSFLSGAAEMKQAQKKVNRENWESVLAHHQSKCSRLLDRIARKQEEIKSLRDGVSF